MADLFSDIIRRCKRDDRKAQEAVYNLLAGKMFAICRRYCACYEEAEDLLHDGFITVFTKIGQFRHAGSFEGWVRKIFVNQALEHYRNNARTVFADKLNDIEHHSIPDDEDNKWEAYQLSEADLLAQIDTLPQQYKVVFNLYTIDGLSHREISGLLGISEGTSRSNLLRARGILQKQINEQVNLLSYKKRCK